VHVMSEGQAGLLCSTSADGDDSSAYGGDGGLDGPRPVRNASDRDAEGLAAPQAGATAVADNDTRSDDPTVKIAVACPWQAGPAILPYWLATLVLCYLFNMTKCQYIMTLVKKLLHI